MEYKKKTDINSQMKFERQGRVRSTDLRLIVYYVEINIKKYYLINEK